MFNKGMFYQNGLEIPKYIFDLNPIVENCPKGDATALPLDDNSVGCMILDPPFLFGIHGKTEQNPLSKRYTIIKDFETLKELYKGILKESYRVLRKNGLLIFKCQDYTDNKTTMTHCFVWEWARQIGFYAKDLAIMNIPSKIYNGNTTQRHLRKTHTYFYVFVKKAKIKYENWLDEVLND